MIRREAAHQFGSSLFYLFTYRFPYLFADKQEAYYVLDNTLQKELEPKFEAQGFKHLGFCELGFRHFTNNKKEVTKASDMKGLSIRVQESPIWFSLADHLGFIATPIARALYCSSAGNRRWSGKPDRVYFQFCV